MNFDARTEQTPFPKAPQGMNFRIVLSFNGESVEQFTSWVETNNDFGTASMMAVAALFRNKDANNVACFRIYEAGTVAQEQFFYGEKA